MKIVRFGSYSIPQTLGEWGVPIEALPGGQKVLGAGGVWDDLGDLVVIAPRKVTAKFALYGSSWTSVNSDLDDAREALLNKRDILYVNTGDELGVVTRQALARCIALDEQYKYDRLYTAICQATFEMLQPHWDSVDPVDDDYDTGVINFNSNSTCRVQRTLKIRLYGPLTVPYTLTNGTNGMVLGYDGNAAHITANHYVEFDCGALTVRWDNGFDLYQYSSFGSNQIGFMALEPGVNVLYQDLVILSLKFQYHNAYL